MYICVCKAVSDSRIRRLVGEGACTLRDLSRETGLGSGCGKCVPSARQVLAESLASTPPPALTLVSGTARAGA